MADIEERRQKVDGPMITRAVSMESDAILDEENRRIRLSFSSETPYLRDSWFDDPWMEILGHDPKEVDMSRMKTGAPFLFNHNSRSIENHIGVIEKAWIEDKRGMAEVRLSKSPEIDPVWIRIKEGTLTNISVGYQIKERKLTKQSDGNVDEYRVTRWVPMEISAVPLPADATVGIGRSADFVFTDIPATSPATDEDNIMPSNAQEPAVVDDGKDVTVRSADAPVQTDLLDGNEPDQPVTQPEPKKPAKRAAKAAEPTEPAQPEPTTDQRSDKEPETVKPDLTEITAIIRACNSSGVPDMAERFINQGLTLAEVNEQLQTASKIREVCTAAKLSNDQADEYIRAGRSVDWVRNTILDMMLAKQDKDDKDNPVDTSQRSAIVTGEDAIDKFKRGMFQSLMEKAGLVKERDPQNEYRAYTLEGLARRSLELHNVSFSGADRMQMVGRAFTHSTSDFDNVLADIAHKALLKGYEEQMESFELWTSRGVLTDYKVNKRVDTNLFPSLAEVPEGAEYTYATMTDRGEPIQLATYGKLFSITRHAIINDDLGAFTKTPMKMGRAAKRTIGNLVYAVLTDNAALSDTVALFHANHNNLLTAGTISTATVDAVRTAMATQSDPDGNATGGLNIILKYLIVPHALKGLAETVANSEFEVNANRTARTPNYVRGAFEVVADARLDTDDATTWYASADPNVTDTIEVSYLDGNSEPFLEQQEGWTVDGTSFKVRIDAGVAPLSHVGLTKTPGS